MAKAPVPEAARVEPPRNVHAILAGCTKCEACVPLCPTKSISFGSAHFVIDRDTCEGCRICVSVCPVDVIFPVKRFEEEEERRRKLLRRNR